MFGLLVAAALVAGFAASGGAAAQQAGYASVNGLKMYYEIHGTGRPLILLHGGIGGIEVFGPNLPTLARSRQVTALPTAVTAFLDTPARSTR